MSFSIKSLMGQKSTLYNTGAGNNFIYTVELSNEISVSEFNKSTYSQSGKASKIATRLQKLHNDYSAIIKFKQTQSSQFMLNLQMIDGDLPEILAYGLLYRWMDGTHDIDSIVELLENRDPLNFYSEIKTVQKLYGYKLKKFLAECAMGMTSEKPWEGIYDTTGGVIVCKQDGDIVCFHIYDFNLFRDYLLQNTMFEQPSTGEDARHPGNPNLNSDKKYYWGWLFEEDGKLFFKINLQVRFK